MCAKGLSAIIRRNKKALLLHVRTIARGAPTITHLSFADDYYFIFKTVELEGSVMKRIWNRYETILGHMVNFDEIHCYVLCQFD